MNEVIQVACIKRTGNPCRCKRCERKHAAFLLGKIRTKKKAKSSRINGKLGGRPKTKV